MGIQTSSGPGSAVATRLVDARTAGQMLGVGRTTLWRLHQRGELRCVHIGGAARWAVADIDDYIAKLRSGQPAAHAEPD
jgi:predicted DNA-binding transcriptional regulator AlpA